MTVAAYPTLNGYAPSWADISTSATVYGGPLIEMTAYKSIDWSSIVEEGRQKGASGGRDMLRTVGQVSHTAKATFYRSGLRALDRALMAVAPVRGNQRLISLVGFDVLIQHTPPGESDIYVVKLVSCRKLSDSETYTEGTEAETADVDLNPIYIAKIIDGEEVVLL